MEPAQKGVVTDSIEGLVALDQKVGIHDHGWEPVGPDLGPGHPYRVRAGTASLLLGSLA